MTRTFRFAVDHSLSLPLGVCIAFAWANVMPEGYFTFAHQLSFVVNDIGMAIFVALTFVEVMEVATSDLALFQWRGLVVALIAATGGVLGAALLYVAYVRAGDEASLLARGWPIVCATDFVLAYAIARSLCRPRAVPFLLLVGIVSNGIGLVVLDFTYPIRDLRGSGAALLILAVVVAILLRRWDVKTLWPYLLGCGGLSWCGLFLIGVHPVLAFVPIGPLLKGTSISREPLDAAAADTHDGWPTLHHSWSVPLQLLLFLFGLTNAGVVVRSFGTGTWALAIATLAGRPAGTLLAVGIAAAAGLHLPRGIRWRDMLVVALASGVGFTFALFFATVIFPIGPVLNELKLGALITVSVPLLTKSAATMLRLRGFAQRVTRRHAPTPHYVGV